MNLNSFCGKFVFSGIKKKYLKLQRFKIFNKNNEISYQHNSLATINLFIVKSTFIIYEYSIL